MAGPMPEPGRGVEGADSSTSSTVTAAEGVRFTVVVGAEADDPISRSLADGQYPQATEPLLRLLRGLAPPGRTVLDLGAHVGTFALAAAAAGYRVIAVEASPRNAALLRASVAQNGFDRMTVVHAAVSDRPGSLSFRAAGPYGHIAGAPGDPRGVEVAAIAVDTLLTELAEPDVAFLKMDVEGSEVAALRGMAGLLRRADAPPIVYESNGHTLDFFGLTPGHLKAQTERFGYRNYRAEPDWLRPVRAGDFQPETVVDYLALKRSTALPRDWSVGPRLARDELVARALASCTSPHAPERRYIAGALARAPRSIRTLPEVRAAVAVLRADPDEAVRAAASRSAEPRWLAAWTGRLSLPRRRTG